MLTPEESEIDVLLFGTLKPLDTALNISCANNCLDRATDNFALGALDYTNLPYVTHQLELCIRYAAHAITNLKAAIAVQHAHAQKGGGH